MQLQHELPTEQSGLPERLRDATRSVHQEMHRHPLMSRLLSHSIALQDYQRVLLAYRQIYHDVDPILVRSISSHAIPYEYQPKSDWLESDLDYFGIENIAMRPGSEAAVGVMTREQVLGSLYVLEGSTQGGEWIYKALAKSLGVSDAQGGRFFYGYGAASATKWANFKEILAENDNNGPEAIVTAAMEMFSRFRQALDYFDEVAV